MTTWILIFGLGLCTFLPRYLPLVLWGQRELSPLAKTVLGAVPPAVLAALVVPAMLVPTGTAIDFSVQNPYLLGSVAVFVLFFLTRRMLLSSFIGVLVFFAVQWFFGRV
ncbi:AzlD domain-containing protein [Pseudomonas fluorescens]|jgi:branched-subunit amino acid transport protein|uniref:AzlD domain-containing protein n=1 Tax=Pseudomonas fluorescens TaxID=294 RepID=A0A2N1EF41_PSEFL|nr:MULTISPECIES: AzlD domain-containing protein [Pseudomonas]MBD8097740.1 AzlD domain-containing protein [Pseudomonas fluorescens]MBD8773848.1 AzlD domain-containing protein [Pseudomonas fluorescens]MBD8778096.1 AzlD domain-containing protein [Pseudomonas fluorescens]MBD8793636.1 AzlD domain-containing protein [Pseudomonas fluorescens]PKH27162.1 AzlD domain-containing protein [Pseudomonas fluorescens]